MEGPIISVVMPVWNGAAFLEDAIQSCLSQTFNDFELLVLDDGSEDSSRVIAQKFKDHRVHLITLPHRGLVSTLNEGLQIARGKYIARMDADDLSMPSRFQRQVEFLDMNPNYGLIGSGYFVMNQHRTVYAVFPVLVDPVDVALQLMYKNPLGHGTVMVRTELLNRHNLRYRSSARHFEDYDLWLRLSRLTRMTNLPDTLYVWMENPSGVTSQQRAVMDEGARNLISQTFTDKRKQQQIDEQLSYFYSRRSSYHDVRELYSGKSILIGRTAEYQYHLLRLAQISLSSRRVVTALRLLLVSVAIRPWTYLKQLQKVPAMLRRRFREDSSHQNEKKIIMVFRFLSPLGGYYSYLDAIVPALSAKGYSIRIVAMTIPDLHDQIFRRLPGMSVTFLPPPRLTNALNIWVLRKEIARQRSRFVMSNDLYESLIARISRLFFRNVRCCAVVHSTLRDMPGNKRITVNAIYLLNKILRGMVDMYICVSQYTARRLAFEGIPQRKITVIPNGIPEHRMAAHGRSSAKDNRLSIGFVGRLSYEKGVDVFLEVAAACQDLPVSFHVYGWGPLEESVVRRTAEQPNCHFHGGEENMYALYGSIDVLLVTSRSEGWPYIVLEAFQQGVVVVANAAGGLPEVVGDRGILIEDNSVPEFKAAVQRLLDHPGEYDLLNERGRQFIQRDASAVGMAEHYDRILQSL